METGIKFIVHLNDVCISWNAFMNTEKEFNSLEYLKELYEIIPINILKSIFKNLNEYSLSVRLDLEGETGGERWDSYIGGTYKAFICSVEDFAFELYRYGKQDDERENKPKED